MIMIETEYWFDEHPSLGIFSRRVLRLNNTDSPGHTESRVVRSLDKQGQTTTRSVTAHLLRRHASTRWPPHSSASPKTSLVMPAFQLLNLTKRKSDNYDESSRKRPTLDSGPSQASQVASSVYPSEEHWMVLWYMLLHLVS
jgi:hypothetical protein